ncbi:hypothetical protein [Streptomyces chiangmaiensis]|uniref:Uncharacterized protein n=1 Tax=Streptomyces chiangmaiensis TaxID=766497 RepID=A0ABU7FV13_9ACTN|nr:hypothetical protein [Streptomyces chiangmaiensis]MED7827936.1 hypothetical protein [Streptomyces chiangmaiensis]
MSVPDRAGTTGSHGAKRRRQARRCRRPGQRDRLRAGSLPGRHLPAPVLGISKSHRGHFAQDQQGIHTITVGITGTGAADGSTVTVHDTS